MKTTKPITNPRAGLELVSVWMPKNLVRQVDVAASKEDSDRSKYVRNAVRDRLARNGARA